jgi:multidrug resistance efflux pump
MGCSNSKIAAEVVALTERNAELASMHRKEIQDRERVEQAIVSHQKLIEQNNIAIETLEVEKEQLSVVIRQQEDLIFRLKENEAARLKAEDDSQIKFSEASFDVSSSVFKRSQELYEKIAESLDDLEKKRLEKIKAGFQIDVSKREQKINEAAVGVNEAKLNASLVQLELRTIKAPFSGVVASVQKERFDWVKAGEEILRLF